MSYMYGQLLFSCRLLNDTICIEDNAASNDRVINDAMKKVRKKVVAT
jgi:hypothetical protein